MRKFLIGGGFLLLLPAAFLYLRQPDIPRAVLEAKYAVPPSQFLTLPEGTRAHVRDRGPRDALPLVLIHGSNASLFTWEPWVKRLNDRFRIITLDLPGHGLTGAVPSGDYTQEGMVKFIDEDASMLGLHQFAMVATPWGAAHPFFSRSRIPKGLPTLSSSIPVGFPPGKSSRHLWPTG